ncbi:MAG TPA: LysR substrate-binding domain-containing protein [Pseudonocardiaceae bacterium]|nr:LysR substrate-binding domain-containing protein [Pseudonocardiaceae bacterium]
MDVDLRKLRYFVAVAEERHFGRAALRLHIAQPVLSRQIKALEDELKTPLLMRDRRSTELTPAGEQLLADARPLLANASALLRRVTRAARGSATFVVGFMAGLIVTAPIRELTARHPGLTVDVVRTGWDAVDAVHDGRVDVTFLRLPVDRRGLRIQPLITEPRVATLPADHRLAGKEHVSIADLADDPLLQDPEMVPEWRDIATVAPGPLPVFHSVEEKLEHVAAGHGVCVLPLSAATFYSRADVTHVPIRDIPPNRVALAWDGTRRDGIVHEFAAIAADHADSVIGRQGVTA